LLLPAGGLKKARGWPLKLRHMGVDAEFVRCDVRHEDDLRSLIDKTVERFGRLDVAVNNAGREGKPGPVTERPPRATPPRSIPMFLARS